MLQNLEVKTDLNKLMNQNTDAFVMLPGIGGAQDEQIGGVPEQKTLSNSKSKGCSQAHLLKNTEAIDQQAKSLPGNREDELTRHYEKIERAMNEEPFMVYKKNNLLLEKIILDRTLNKVQKRRFIHSNMPKIR